MTTASTETARVAQMPDSSLASHFNPAVSPVSQATVSKQFLPDAEELRKIAVPSPAQEPAAPVPAASPPYPEAEVSRRRPSQVEVSLKEWQTEAAALTNLDDDDLDQAEIHVQMEEADLLLLKNADFNQPHSAWHLAKPTDPPHTAVKVLDNFAVQLDVGLKATTIEAKAAPKRPCCCSCKPCCCKAPNAEVPVAIKAPIAEVKNTPKRPNCWGCGAT
eukprot:gnl/TRDRNA2_/TRDRNA2_166697_c1_seq1.p1 gnl/TRDRNA2_/TRDRNA2_166697_c1~~gnl/TRDRNA2_/TRDRNA2_166697_c1_seq1.p1  ORF type:complete len:218 (+),score=31.82 gnl/TRDRNA2_/TRDRNA2_166697_c1_seq1:29-682(+)